MYFEDSVKEEYEELVYLISRGKYDAVLAMIQEMNFDVKSDIRPTGDTIMHVCAEFG